MRKDNPVNGLANIAALLRQFGDVLQTQMRYVARLTTGIVLLLWTVTPASAADLYKAKGVAVALRTTSQIAKRAMSEYYSVKGSLVGGFVSPKDIDDGFLSTGQEVLIVPLQSGGSGGVFLSLLWTKSASAWKFIGYLSSTNGHLDVHIAYGRLLAITPVYKSADASCCPSGHIIAVYAVNGGGRLTKVTR